MGPENFEAISRSAKLPWNLEVIHTNRLLISNCSVVGLLYLVSAELSLSRTRTYLFINMHPIPYFISLLLVNKGVMLLTARHQVMRLLIVLDINMKWEMLLGYQPIFANLYFIRTMQWPKCMILDAHFPQSKFNPNCGKCACVIYDRSSFRVIIHNKKHRRLQKGVRLSENQHIFF